MKVYWLLFVDRFRVIYGPALFVIGLCGLLLAHYMQESRLFFWGGGLAFAVGLVRVAYSAYSKGENS